MLFRCFIAASILWLNTACSVVKEVPLTRIEGLKSNEFELYHLLLEKTETNVYMLCTQTKECVLVDPALEAKRLAGTCRNRKFNIRAIFLTHNHWDHSKEIVALSDMLKVPIVCNQKQLEMGKTDLGTPILTENRVTVTDRQTVRYAGIDLTILFSPGHSMGSMCFYHSASGSLFSGDTLFKESIGRTDFEGSQGELIINSINTVLNAVENDTVIYPGHGPKTTKGSRKNKFRF